jgi:pantetheine-phosphate adenylyltransferase
MLAIYPGSFDPITYGHLDIIERAANLVDKLLIVIMMNDEKQGTFTFEERRDMVVQATRHLKNVEVIIGDGLTAEFAERKGAGIIIRGIRAVSDYEYEMQLATANMALNSEIHTVFLVAQPQFSFLSSSTAKTIAKNKGDLRFFVPDCVAEELVKKYNKGE